MSTQTKSSYTQETYSKHKFNIASQVYSVFTLTHLNTGYTDTVSLRQPGGASKPFIIAVRVPTFDRELHNRLSKSRAETQIDSFNDLSKGWDSYNAEPPNNTAVNNALTTLDALEKCSKFPTKISPSADEGILFEFLSKANYYLLEFCNDGDMIFLKRINGKTEAFDTSVNDIESKIDEIKL